METFKRLVLSILFALALGVTPAVMTANTATDLHVGKQDEQIAHRGWGGWRGGYGWGGRGWYGGGFYAPYAFYARPYAYSGYYYGYPSYYYGYYPYSSYYYYPGGLYFYYR